MYDVRISNGSTASRRLGAVRIECRMVPWYVLVDKDGRLGMG